VLLGDITSIAGLKAKPFSLTDLVQMVRETVDRQPSSDGYSSRAVVSFSTAAARSHKVSSCAGGRCVNASVNCRSRC